MHVEASASEGPSDGGRVERRAVKVSPGVAGYDHSPMAVAEISRTAARPWRVRPWQRWSLGVVIVGELAAWYAVLSSGGWSYDDNLLLEQAHYEGFSWAFLGGNTFGHWGVGYPGTYWVFDQLMPIDYRWGLVTMLVELGVAMLLLARVMEMLFGRGQIPVLSAAYLGISVLLIRSLQWPAQGFQTFPTLIFDLLSLWAYLRYQRDSRVRWIVVSAGAIFVGLQFYEKPAFMLFYLLVLRVLVLDDQTRPRTVAKAIWRERGMWLAYAAVVVIYVAGREAANATSTGAGVFPTIEELGHALWLMWSKALVPALFGYSLPTANVDTVQLVGGCVLQVLVASLVIISIRRKRSAWRAWAALALFILATWLLVGAERIGTAGLEAATDQRYLIDFTWLAPLLVCLAFSRRRTFIPPPVAATPPPGQGLRPTLSVVAALLMLAYVGVSVAVAAKWQSLWGGEAARTWEQNLQGGLAGLHPAHGALTVADNFVPGYLIQTSYVPYSYLSFLIPEYGGQINANGPISGQLFVVDSVGRLRRAHVARVWETLRLGSRCGGAPGALRHIDRLISARLDPAAGPYYLRVTYSSGGVARLPLFADDGLAGVQSRLVTVARGRGHSIAWLGAGAPRRLTLDSPRYVCLRQLAIVTLAMN